MATTSTSGVNLLSSQIDVPSIVNAYMQAASVPVQNMQSEVSTLQSKVSAFRTLNTKLSTLSTQVNQFLYTNGEPALTPYNFSDRLSQSIFSTCAATSSNDNAISVSTSTGAAAGSYSMTVNNLAAARSIASDGLTSATNHSLGTGMLTITTGNNDPVSITLNNTNNTLNGLKDAINGANAGVVASIINDGSNQPYKLLVTAKQTGLANSFSINTGGLSGGQALSFTEQQAAQVTLAGDQLASQVGRIEFEVSEIAGIADYFTFQEAADGGRTCNAELLAGYKGIRGVLCIESGADLPVALKGVHHAGAKANDRVTRRRPILAIRTRTCRIEITLLPMGSPRNIVR